LGISLRASDVARAAQRLRRPRVRLALAVKRALDVLLALVALLALAPLALVMVIAHLGGHTGPRRLMAPGLTGPAQRWADDHESAARLDDSYVARWSLAGDLRLLSGAARRRAVSPS
jgi:lipopolysaccharide/colanic/teichoic acid biosynthesis glycosyltransferase